jgi:hypothetical protein
MGATAGNVLRSTGRRTKCLRATTYWPCVAWCVLHGVEDATLLRLNDEPIMTKFGLLRHA